jgi:hypothetical protein
MVSRTDYSSLSKASPTTNSLKCTVPTFVVKLLNLEHGDTLAWHTEGTPKGIMVIVSKKEDGEDA